MQAEVGIIGGSGLGEALVQLGGTPVDVCTPFGQPSASPILAECEGVRVAFLSRHGAGHRFNPSSVPYRANVWALRQLGCQAVIASGATGSLREDIEPGHLVICDQVIDRTSARPGTFFDNGLVAHVELADPFCPALRRLLIDASTDVDTPVHHAGTYVCMEGPQFSTRAESHMHRQWGGDLIGMTAMPEAKLAREAELCYALVALPTDYDCWRPHDQSRPAHDLLQEIIGNLQSASASALALIRAALRRWPHWRDACSCGEALRFAVWTDKRHVPGDVRDRLDLLIDRYIRRGDPPA